MAIGVKQMKAGDPHLDFKLEITGESDLSAGDVIRIIAEVYVPTNSTPDESSPTWGYPEDKTYSTHHEPYYVVISTPTDEQTIEITGYKFNDEDYNTNAADGVPLGVKIRVLKRSGEDSHSHTYREVDDTITYIAENDSNDPTKNQVVSGDMLQGVYENPTSDGHED